MVAELTAMLRRHGLEIERMDANVDGTRFTPESDRLFIVARRR